MENAVFHIPRLFITLKVRKECNKNTEYCALRSFCEKH